MSWSTVLYDAWQDNNAVWLTCTVVGTGAWVITTSSEISKHLRVFSMNEAINLRNSENKIAYYFDIACNSMHFDARSVDTLHKQILHFFILL